MELNFDLKKYPRTPHLTGSRLQPGDEDLSQIPFSMIDGKHIVIEEKIDGANSAISFDENGNLMLQSRGHYLTGGYRERHYNLMKQWARVHEVDFYAVLGERYIMYGEWMYAKHGIYYDALPAYFMEFDILDRETGLFLDTHERQKLTSQMPICSVPVLAEGVFKSPKEVLSYLGPSNYIREGHIERLRQYCFENGLDADRCCAETDSSIMMEGLYIKVEEDGYVKNRLKYVRASFAQAVDNSGSHWIDRPIVPNKLAVPLETLYLPKE
ncbi:MAG: RNA ligase family protein [Lachnospiraceae bacterium]